MLIDIYVRIISVLVLLSSVVTSSRGASHFGAELMFESSSVYIYVDPRGPDFTASTSPSRVQIQTSQVQAHTDRKAMAMDGLLCTNMDAYLNFVDV
ncbi:hypothetical protein DFJ58DRAFT_797873 [Suillus subalutaceus]|uniref:uncharacterized protein n=1 Tax=Suillus subalutaceus TaxID=48586 RepID=UPI001B884356|nr:uncharacterized protein DFJ58DRAFT_797873 [Suillus subalutaceus]KAG1847323.1 hypothetical protein DFJ58DRAFT_797873 [Suillus subalutaceus]